MIRFFFLFLPLMIDAQTIKIVSWNVENLFDMHRDGTEYAEYVPGRHGWSEAMLLKKLRNLTEVICDLEADIVALQEVENERALKRLQRSLKRAGCAYRCRAITSDTRASIHNALLSNIPLKQTQDVRVTRYGRQRSILEATLDTDPSLRLFVNHWRSKRGPESERMAYARALKKRLERLPGTAAYLLIGDFNSHYSESLTIDPKHNDTHNQTGINTVLKTMRANRMVRLNDLRRGEHYNLWMELGTSQRWSHNFFGDKEAIDAILIPASLHDGRGWEFVPGSFRVYKPRYLFGKRGRINRWAYRHGKHLGKGYSDHLPIVATFTNGSTSPKGDEKVSRWWGRLLDRVTTAWGRSGTTADAQPLVATSHNPKQALSAAPSTIADLKKAPAAALPLRIDHARVLWRRRDSAVIQQQPKGEAILIYRAAMQLEEGHCYDLNIYKTKRYHGMDEVTDLEVATDHGGCDTQGMIRSFDPGMMSDRHQVGHVVRGIQGRYTKHAIEVGGVSVPIHFQKRAGRPKSGQKVTIGRTVVGYYGDHVELQVWEKGDWR
jgi:endonuclease/exonuclease/phosphatase family metal-dependent hydrolase